MCKPSAYWSHFWRRKLDSLLLVHAQNPHLKFSTVTESGRISVTFFLSLCMQYTHTPVAVCSSDLTAFKPQKKFLDSCEQTSRRERQVLQLLPRYKTALVGSKLLSKGVRRRRGHVRVVWEWQSGHFWMFCVWKKKTQKRFLLSRVL